MKLKYYINKKIPIKEKSAFFRHWSIINDDIEINIFWEDLMSKQWNSIVVGINLIGSLEIKDDDMENKFVNYANEIISSEKIQRFGNADILEAILWNIGIIGTTNSINFIEDTTDMILIKRFSEFELLGNLSHMISACQFSYFQISQDKHRIKTYFDKTIKYRKLHIPDESEIEIHRKTSETYANYL